MKRSICTIMAIVMVASLLTVAIPINVSNDIEAKSPIVVEDGLGNEFSFDGTPKKMVTLGKGFTATAIRLGLTDNIIVCDKYSVTDNDPLFDGLKSKVDSGEIKAKGSTYSSGLDDVKADIVSMTENMGLQNDLDEIVVFVTGTKSSMDSISTFLKDKGYEYILCWESITSYEKIVDFVEVMSLVMTGEVGDIVRQMSNVVDHIEDTLSNKSNFQKREAFFVTYSGGGFKVGNTGSLANSMILAAGGNSITTNANETGTTYETNITNLIATYGTDVVIFLDNSIASNADHLNNLKTIVGSNDVKFIPLNPLWNNYCVESMEGVWAMACAMYPDEFSGDVPEVPNDSDDGNMIVFVIAGIIGVIVIGVASFVYLRK